MGPDPFNPGKSTEPTPEPEQHDRSGDVEYHQAIATFRDVLPVADIEEWKIQKDGTWVCRQTGESRDTQP